MIHFNCQLNHLFVLVFICIVKAEIYIHITVCMGERINHFTLVCGTCQFEEVEAVLHSCGAKIPSKISSGIIAMMSGSSDG